jgi:hypothetical protein
MLVLTGGCVARDLRIESRWIFLIDDAMGPRTNLILTGRGRVHVHSFLL